MELMELDALPADFLARMRALLGERDFRAYEKCLGEPPFRGIRLNPLKCAEGALRRALPFPIRPAPFSPLSFYMPPDVRRPGHLPMHHAGAFYVQEPSAAAAVTALGPRPGEKILDLCAAPGGKSTQIAGLLAGRGLLWSNEVVRGRAGALLSNLERTGVRNAVVSCCRPEKLCPALAGFFDRVLVDAPCSEEGMFRREPRAVRAWSPAQVKACAARQAAILGCAAGAVRQGGALVYSTCTFSREEDEGAVSAFLKSRPDFELTGCGLSCGRPALLPQARRIYPMDGGEGHFVAVLRRLSAGPCAAAPYRYAPAAREKTAPLAELYRRPLPGCVEERGGRLFLLPAGLPDLAGLGVLRAGVPLGRLLPGRFQPEHAAFMAAAPEDLNSVLMLSHDSPEIMAFLRGEELAAPDLPAGYAGVAVDGVTAGFGKCSGGRLKNHYPKGLRNHF